MFGKRNGRFSVLPNLQNLQISRSLCNASVALLLSLLFYKLWGNHPPAQLVSPTVTPEHIELFSMVDTTAQKTAYRVFLVSIALVTLLRLLVQPRSGASGLLTEKLGWLPYLALLLGVGFLCGLELFRVPGIALLGLAGAVGLSLMSIYIGNRRFGFLRSMTLITIIIAALFVHELFIVRDFSMLTGRQLASVDWHMNYLLGDGDRLASGGRLFSEVNPRIGWITPVLIGGWQRLFGWISFGNLMHVVSWTNALFFLGMFALYYRTSKGMVAYALLVMGILFSWLHMYHPSVMYPNQSALRHLNFLGGLWGTFLLLRLPFNRAGMWIGPLCTIMLLFNLETGIAISGGMVIGFFLRFRQELIARKTARRELLMRFLAGTFGVLGVSVLVSRLLLGSWPGLPTGHGIFTTIASFTSGYGGLWEPMAPFVLLMLGHATWVVLEAFSCKTNAHSRSAFRTAVAMIILIWFSYYANRAARWNIWTLQVLYSFLMLDLFRSARLVARPRWRPTAALSVIILGFLVLPYTIYVNGPHVRSYWRTIASMEEQPKTGTVVSDIRIRSDLAENLMQQAKALRSRRGKVTYITGSPFLVSRLSGVRSTIPFVDVFHSVFSKSDYETLMNSVALAEEIMITSKDSEIDKHPFYQKYMFRLRRDLESRGYSLARTDEGWEYWLPGTKGQKDLRGIKTLLRQELGRPEATR